MCRYIFQNGDESGRRNENDTPHEEETRTRVFHANTKLAQGMNSFIVQNLKKKGKVKGIDPWFSAPFIPIAVITKCNLRRTGDKSLTP